MASATAEQIDASAVPALAAGLDPSTLPLSPSEGYLLSRIDGRTSWRLLREIGGLAPGDVDRCLGRWLAEGVLRLDGATRGSAHEPAGSPVQGAATSSASARPPNGGSPAPRAAPGAPAPPAIDPTLDMPVDAQQRVLDFEARIDAAYHVVLGVEPGADVKAVKRAYFELSREFHPDRWFRREIGAFAPRVERVFKRILEAYEILSDPTARAELERAGRDGERPTASARGEEAPPSEKKTFVMPHVHAARMRAMAERRGKARSFFESGMKAFAEERWLEAAGSVRLAIVFDPANEAIRDAFGDVQRRAHAERAKQLLREARGALEMRDPKDALRLFEEALLYAPHDAEANHTAARLLLVLGEDARRAKEYAQRAVELQPEVALHRRTLGQIYAAAGLVANARRELGAALKLDPSDREAKEALRGLERR